MKTILYFIKTLRFEFGFEKWQENKDSDHFHSHIILATKRNSYSLSKFSISIEDEFLAKDLTEFLCSVEQKVHYAEQRESYREENFSAACNDLGIWQVENSTWWLSACRGDLSWSLAPFLHWHRQKQVASN